MFGNRRWLQFSDSAASGYGHFFLQFFESAASEWRKRFCPSLTRDSVRLCRLSSALLSCSATQCEPNRCGPTTLLTLSRSNFFACESREGFPLLVPGGHAEIDGLCTPLLHILFCSFFHIFPCCIVYYIIMPFFCVPRLAFDFGISMNFCSRHVLAADAAIQWTSITSSMQGEQQEVWPTRSPTRDSD